MEYSTTTRKTSNRQQSIYERSKEEVHQHVLSTQMFLYGLHAVELTPVVQLQKKIDRNHYSGSRCYNETTATSTAIMMTTCIQETPALQLLNEYPKHE